MGFAHTHIYIYIYIYIHSFEYLEVGFSSVQFTAVAFDAHSAISFARRDFIILNFYFVLVCQLVSGRALREYMSKGKA